jgi:hypothetical protein
LSSGDAVAKKRRMPSAKGFDFFIESSFTELYSENCHDLYAKGAKIGSNLPVRQGTEHLQAPEFAEVLHEISCRTSVFCVAHAAPIISG